MFRPARLVPGRLGRNRCSMAVESRLLLAERRTTVVLGSQSMLDGCGIETLREISVRSVGSVFVAIDARWLWNRSMSAFG